MKEVIDMGDIIRYEHHGVEVSVDEDLKGKHRELCLCWRPCAKFHPKDRPNSCPRANLLYAYDVAFGMVTPVVECSEFEPVENARED